MYSTQGLEKTKVLHQVESAVNTALQITLPAAEQETHVLFQIQASFSDAPTAPAQLEVSIGGVTVFSAFLSEAGIEEVVFYRPLYGYDNQEMVIDLDAGGVGITGTLNIQYG